MNPLAYACTKIKQEIPIEILNTIFLRNVNTYGYTPASLDEQLMSLVIRPIVLVDCNIVGGDETIIPLDNVIPIRYDNISAVYRIPKTLTQNRTIISALSVSIGNPVGPARAGLYGANTNQSRIASLARGVLEGASASPILSSANLDIIGENTILVKGMPMFPNNSFLRCRVSNDENMNNLHARAMGPFSELCIFAAKKYIYNTYVIKLDQGELYAGAAIGVFKEIITSYADSSELYKTFLKEKMTKILFMNDTISYNRLLQTIVAKRS